MATDSLRKLRALHDAGTITRDDLRACLLVVARDALGDVRTYQRRDGSTATVSAPNFATCVKALELVAKCEGYVQRAGGSADAEGAEGASDADIDAAMLEHLRSRGYNVEPAEPAAGAVVRQLKR